MIPANPGTTASRGTGLTRKELAAVNAAFAFSKNRDGTWRMRALMAPHASSTHRTRRKALLAAHVTLTTPATPAPAFITVIKHIHSIAYVDRNGKSTMYADEAMRFATLADAVRFGCDYSWEELTDGGKTLDHVELDGKAHRKLLSDVMRNQMTWPKPN